MTRFKESIGLALLCAAIPIAPRAQTPTVGLEDYTSDMVVTSIEGFSVAQQIGSPLAPPVQYSGDTHLYQGLFNVVSGTDASPSSGIDPVIFTEDAGITMSFDAALKQLQITCPELPSDVELIIVDIAGGLSLRTELRGMGGAVDISTLSTGTYLAGIVINNRFFKTYKFIVK